MDERRIPFTKEDEEKIASAGIWGIVVAITSIASAALGMILTFAAPGKAGNVVSQFIGLTVSVLLAVMLYKASVAFRKVALTDVADQQYLLEGFRNLRAYFMTTGIIIIVVVSLAVLGFLAALACRAAIR